MDYRDFFVEVAKGNIAEHSVVAKFGHNEDIINGVWGLISSSHPSGAFPVSGSTVRVKAGGNAADIEGGLGAHEITIVGINEDLVEVSEDIITSGVNQSLSTTNIFWRVYRAFVSKCGTYSEANIGDIIIENAEDMLFISADEGQSEHGAYTIPSGKKGYLVAVRLTVNSNKAADFRLFTRDNITDAIAPFSPKKLRFSYNGVLGQVGHTSVAPSLELPALTDIWVEARGGGANTEASADFEILLVDDPTGPVK